jgi:hypothetical protein
MKMAQIQQDVYGKQFFVDTQNRIIVLTQRVCLWD